MKNVMKAAVIVSIATLGLSLGGCNSGPANANAAATPDPAEQTAASIDQAAPAAAPAPSEAPEKAPK